MRNFLTNHKLAALILIVIGAGVLIGGFLYVAAAGPLAHTTIGGQGTITVPAPTTSTTTTTTTTSAPVVVQPTYGLSVTTVGPLDFSGSVSSNGDNYAKQITVQVQNTGTNGSGGGAPATFNTITATLDASTPLPTGWTISGETDGTLTAGSSESLNITLTSPALTSTVVLPSFTIDVNGN